MDEIELEALQRSPKWISTLKTYQQLATEKSVASKEFDGWVPRVLAISEIPDEELPGIHGKLIAYGFLKFDLAGRDAGIRYQLTTLGKQGINASASSDDSPELAVVGSDEVAAVA